MRIKYIAYSIKIVEQSNHKGFLYTTLKNVIYYLTFILSSEYLNSFIYKITVKGYLVLANMGRMRSFCGIAGAGNGPLAVVSPYTRVEASLPARQDQDGFDPRNFPKPLSSNLVTL